MNAAAIYTQTLQHFLRPVQCLLDDVSVTEVMVVGHQQIYFEKAGRLLLRS